MRQRGKLQNANTHVDDGYEKTRKNNAFWTADRLKLFGGLAFIVFVVLLFVTKPALHLSPSHRKDFRKPHVSLLASDKEQFRRKKGEHLHRFADDRGKPKTKLDDPLGKYNNKRDPLGKYKNDDLARKKGPFGRDIRDRPGRPGDANRQPGKKPPPRDIFRKKDPADPKGKYENGKGRRETPPGMKEREWREEKGADRKKPKKPERFEHSGDYRDSPMRKPEKPRRKEKGRDFDERARKRSYDESMKKKKKPPVKGEKPMKKEKPKGKGDRPKRKGDKPKGNGQKPMKKKMPMKKGEHPDKEKVRKAMEQGLKEKQRKLKGDKGAQKMKKPSPEKMKKGGKPPLKRKKAVDHMNMVEVKEKDESHPFKEHSPEDPFQTILPFRFLIIGAPHSGVNDVFFSICHHPQVVCEAHDTGFFSPKKAEQTSVKSYVSRFPKKGYKENTNCFEFGEQIECTKVDQSGVQLITGEVSSHYMHADPTIVEGIVPKDTKVLFVTRDSAEQSFLEWESQKRTGDETRSFEDLVDEELKLLKDCTTRTKNVEKCLEKHKGIISDGFVKPSLKRWSAVFGKRFVSRSISELQTPAGINSLQLFFELESKRLKPIKFKSPDEHPIFQRLRKFYESLHEILDMKQKKPTKKGSPKVLAKQNPEKPMM